MLITTPEEVIKGAQIVLMLNIAELLDNSIISNDLYYSNINNWKKIVVEYSDANRYQKLLFDITNASQLDPESTVNLEASVTQQYFTNYLIFRKLVIYDRANGFIELKRSDFDPQNTFDMEF
jgi:hypothetical protein